MSTLVYTGNAQAVTDVWTCTVAALGSPPTSNTFTLTINGKNLAFVCGSSDTATTAATALVGLANATSAPAEFREYFWTNLTGVITAIADAIGVPGTISSAASNGGGSGTPTFAAVHTVAGTGPNDADNAANYSTGSLPVSTDTLIISSVSPSLLWNLSALSAVTLTLLDVQASFQGTIGLPPVNQNGYYEYRPTYFAIGTTTCRIGDGSGNGSGRIKLAVGSVQAAWQVLSSGSSQDNGIGAVQIKGTSSSNTLDVQGGTVDVAPYGGDTAALATLNIAGGTVHCPSWVVPVAVNQSGGTLNLDAAWSGTLTGTGGSGTISGTPSATAIVLTNCSMNYNVIGGTVTTATVNTGGVINKSNDLSTTTFTDCVLNGGQVVDPNNVITVTNGYSKGTGTKIIQAA